MNIVSELEGVLDEEQELLLTGNYARLEELATRKEALAEALSASTSDLSEEEVQGIATKSAHNEALLNSARRGIQAAISQLRDYTTGEHQSTYSKEGARVPLSRPVSMIQKY